MVAAQVLSAVVALAVVVAVPFDAVVAPGQWLKLT